MLNVKKTLTKIMNYQKDEFVTEEVSVACSFSNQRYKSLTASVAKDGYAPVGIVGWNCGAVDWLIDYLYIIDNTLYTTIFRTSAGTYSTTLKFRVLYRKSS